MEPQPKKLFRSRSDRMIGGICGGMGTYLNLDSTVARLLWVILGFVSAGLAVAAYIVLLFLIPEEPLVAIAPTPPASAPPADTSDETQI